MKLLHSKAFVWVSIVILLAVMVGAFGCAGTAQTTTTTTQTPVVAGETLLTVINGSKTVTYTMSQLKALTSTTGWGAKYTMHGSEGPDQYKGIQVTELLKAVGGITGTQSVKFTASDDYTKTLNYAQVVSGDFSVQDSTGNQVAAITTPVLTVLFEINGASLNDTSGPLLLGILSDKTQFTGGSSWIKKISRIEVISAQ